MELSNCLDIVQQKVSDYADKQTWADTNSQKSALPVRHPVHQRNREPLTRQTDRQTERKRNESKDMQVEADTQTHTRIGF